MSFVPPEKPRGYSYLEDASRDFQNELDKKKFESGIGDTVGEAVLDACLEEVLKGTHGRHATILVQKGVGTLYETPAGKALINNMASISLSKSVQGAAAISHVSKIIRCHGISNFGVMVYKDGKLVKRYMEGDIDGAELGKGLFMETMGQSGDMLGWICGASLASTLLCPPVGAAVVVFLGSTAGRILGKYAARVVMK